jgi:hypothetical protein
MERPKDTISVSLRQILSIASVDPVDLWICHLWITKNRKLKSNMIFIYSIFATKKEAKGIGERLVRKKIFEMA